MDRRGRFRWPTRQRRPEEGGRDKEDAPKRERVRERKKNTAHERGRGALYIGYNSEAISHPHPRTASSFTTVRFFVHWRQGSWIWKVRQLYKKGRIYDYKVRGKIPAQKHPPKPPPLSKTTTKNHHQIPPKNYQLHEPLNHQNPLPNTTTARPGDMGPSHVEKKGRTRNCKSSPRAEKKTDPRRSLLICSYRLNNRGRS